MVHLHRMALQEFHEARRWYLQRSNGAGERFREAVRETIRAIASDPRLPVADQDGMRWWKTKRFPYLLHYYIVDQNEIHVYAVAHERRRPGYWKRRLNSP